MSDIDKDLILEVLGVHAAALEVAVKMFAKTQGGTVCSWLEMLLLAGLDIHQQSSPETLKARLDGMLASIDAIAADPVVIFDPEAGPIRDSELRRICEEAEAAAKAQPPDEPQ